MSKHLIKIDNPQHCALSVAHAGLDNQYCEAGEVVAIDWQPSSGWGLQEAHYTDEDGNVVAIDLTLREFTMPAKAITIGGTAKRFVIQDWKGADTAINAVAVSHSDLIAAIAAGKLETGTWYRITDYQCTTTQEGTKSAGHQFDIVVMAVDESHLCETAFATHHEGDTYFANSDLSAWVLKYSIDNDTDRFAWADDENGKGVVYGMGTTSPTTSRTSSSSVTRKTSTTSSTVRNGSKTNNRQKLRSWLVQTPPRYWRPPTRPSSRSSTDSRASLKPRQYQTFSILKVSNTTTTTNMPLSGRMKTMDTESSPRFSQTRSTVTHSWPTMARTPR